MINPIYEGDEQQAEAQDARRTTLTGGGGIGATSGTEDSEAEVAAAPAPAAAFLSPAKPQRTSASGAVGTPVSASPSGRQGGVSSSGAAAVALSPLGLAPAASLDNPVYDEAEAEAELPAAVAVEVAHDQEVATATRMRVVTSTSTSGAALPAAAPVAPGAVAAEAALPQVRAWGAVSCDAVLAWPWRARPS